MKKLLCLLAIILFAFPATTNAVSTQLLTTPWNMVGNNGSVDKYQSVASNVLNGKASLTLTYDLHGLCLLGNDASAIIFDQNGWNYASLSNYGQNCFNGVQTATIPLSAFINDQTHQPININAPLTGSFHSRIWHSGTWTVDITSAVLNDIFNPTWTLQSVDMMKYSKDVVCAPPTQTFIDQEVTKAVEIGATHVAISGYYNNPACGSSLTLTTAWVNSIRGHGLKVWFRMKDLAFEGDYSTAKTTSPDGMRHQRLMVDWIAANSSLIQTGDIFTPNAEPQNGGINGVTYCGSPANCQFTGKADFNLWLRQTHTMADLAIKAAGKTGVLVGYYGFDGFVAAGLGNPDWQGQSQLEPATIALMGNVAIDHYPETIGHTLAQDMPYIKQAIGANTQIIISEYGTITTSNQTTAASQVSAFMTTAAAEPNVKGFNYWHMGPGGNEALVNSDFTNRPSFTVVQDFYK